MRLRKLSLGFSYIETLIASCLISFVALGSFKVVMFAKQANVSYQQQTVAYQTIQNILAMAQSLVAPDVNQTESIKREIAHTITRFNRGYKPYVIQTKWRDETVLALHLFKDTERMESYVIQL